MKLSNEITVPAEIDEAWDLMLDVERVALPPRRVHRGLRGR